MNLKKISLGIGLIIFAFLIIYSVPFVFRQPSADNIGIAAFFIIIEIAILYFFIKSGKQK